LVVGFALESIRHKDSPQAEATPQDVLHYCLNQWPWEAVQTVVEGRAYHAKSQSGDQGAALFYNDKLVYPLVVTPAASLFWEAPLDKEGLMAKPLGLFTLSLSCGRIPPA
jgi:hypothetical protein